MTLAGIAVAQPASAAPHGQPRLFDRLDGDKDGVVTRDDVKSAAEKAFAELDVDRNGVATQAERAAMRERKREAMFARADSNGDGQVSREEFRAAREMMHSAMDEGKRHGGRGFKRMMQGDVAKADFVARPLAMFDRIDTNRDGKVTSDERDAAATKMRERWQSRRAAPAG